MALKSSYEKMHDSTWLRESFMVSHAIEATEDEEAGQDYVNFRLRVFSSASFKYSDTTVGGNMVMNPVPQFTKYADPPVKGLFSNPRIPDDEQGMGDYYSRAIDDNKRYITMCFGVAQFNSLKSFYTGFYDYRFATLARTGRAPSIFYTAGQVAGAVVGMFAPWLLALSVCSAFVRWASFKSSSKYYYFKPTMANYWNAVSLLANNIATKTQFITRVQPIPFSKGVNTSAGDVSAVMSEDDVRQVNMGMDDIMDSADAETGDSNGINVYAVATRYQRLQRVAFYKLQNYYNDMTFDASLKDGTEAGAELTNRLLGKVREALSASTGVDQPTRSFKNYLKEWTSGHAPGAMPSKGSNPGDTLESSNGGIWSNDANIASDSPEAAGATREEIAAAQADMITEKSITEAKTNSDVLGGWWKFLQAELDDGAQFVSFRVEQTGDAGESFTNSVGVPEIVTKLNGASGSARSTRFSVADGNVSDGMIGKAIGAVAGAAKDLIAGVADSVGLSGALGIASGNAFADIPKYWTDSQADMPRMNYRMRLSSPYGNKYSKFINIWLPFSMLLVGAIPLSTGPFSYTSPFLCQLYDRGRAQTRLGMITSLSVTRGLNNLAFNKIGEPMAIEINFTVTEMSSVLHMPIADNFGPLKDLLSTVFESDSLYNDYIATLTSLSLAEQIYVGERIKLGVTRYLKNLDSYFSVAHATNWLGDLGVMRTASMFFNGTANR